jgi:hypothetical protein
MKKILILGGGTFNPVSNHLSVSAPAFGKTAKDIFVILSKHDKWSKEYSFELKLTKMADFNSDLKSNKDVEEYIDSVLLDNSVSAIILNIAFCDFEYEGGTFNAERKSSSNPINLELRPAKKIIDKIRRTRPDIFLVGFKASTEKSEKEQFSLGLKMMKRAKCNLVLANDVITRNNIIITPEETYYKGSDSSRESALVELCNMMINRMSGTFEFTNFIKSDNFSIEITSQTFQKVMRFLVDSGGFIENNGNGFTPGHFCQKFGNEYFLSSQRLANHNKVFEEGMSKVLLNDQKKLTVLGQRKASVGARSQSTLLLNNPEYDCIIHTHNPLKEDSIINTRPQKFLQCGSLECGLNTLHGLQNYGPLKAVYLEKHGINILFKSSTDPEEIIQFIKDNLELGKKVM